MYASHLLDLERYLSECASPNFLVLNLPRRTKPPASTDHLRDDLVAQAEAARALQDQADREGRDLTPAERGAIDAIYSRFEETERAIDAAEDAESRRGVGRRTEATPVGGGSGRQRQLGFEGRTNSLLSIANLPPGREGRTYADMFGASPSGSDLDPGEFLRLLAHNLNDPRLVRAGQTEGTGEDGGFEVPGTMTAVMHDSGLGDEDLLSRTSNYPMSSNSLTIPYVNSFDRTSSVAGVTSVWISEATAGDLQTAKLGQLTFRANKKMILIPASSEVVNDSLSGGRVYVDIMSDALRYDTNQAILNGTGAGQPLGILNAPSLITVSKESGQAADTLLFQNIVNMWSRLHAACQPRAVWITSSSVIPQLLTMQFVQNATAPMPIFSVGGAASAPTMTLMGRPIIVSEHSPILGDVGDIVLVDLSKLAVGIRGGMSLDRSIHARFTSDEILFRLTFRMDARPMWPTVVTPRSGAPTLSWVVALEAR